MVTTNQLSPPGPGKRPFGNFFFAPSLGTLKGLPWLLTRASHWRPKAPDIYYWLVVEFQPVWKNITPPKSNIDTKNDGPWKMYLLSNMAILGIYVRFQEGSQIGSLFQVSRGEHIKYLSCHDL